jgi:hypothetical protein
MDAKLQRNTQDRPPVPSNELNPRGFDTQIQAIFPVIEAARDSMM